MLTNRPVNASLTSLILTGPHLGWTVYSKGKSVKKSMKSGNIFFTHFKDVTQSINHCCNVALCSDQYSSNADQIQVKCT